MSFVRIILLAGCLLAATGCSWNRAMINGPDFLARAEQVVVGETTKQELPAILGSTPLTWIETGDGREVYVYSYGQSKREGFNLILLQIGKTNTRIDTAYFVVDKDGKIVNKFVGTNSQDVPWEWWAFGD
jgi:hypothetical protein